MKHISICQEKYKNKFLEIAPSCLYSIHDGKRKLLAFLYQGVSVYKRSPFYALDTLAQKIGCSKRTVIRYLKDLREDGFISWQQRYNNSNIYQINPYLIDYKKVILAWYTFFFTLLFLGASQRSFSENGNLKDLKDKFYIPTMSKTMGVKGAYEGHADLEERSRSWQVVAGKKYLFNQEGIPICIETPPFNEALTIKREALPKRGRMNDAEQWETLSRLNDKIKLTSHGMIAFRKFEPEILEELILKTPVALTKQKPAHWLLKLAEDLSRDRRLPVNRHRYEQERKSLKLPPGHDEFVEPCQPSTTYRVAQPNSRVDWTSERKKQEYEAFKKEHARKLDLDNPFIKAVIGMLDGSP